jgi:hypothetical protein
MHQPQAGLAIVAVMDAFGSAVKQDLAAAGRNLWPPTIKLGIMRKLTQAEPICAIRKISKLPVRSESKAMTFFSRGAAEAKPGEENKNSQASNYFILF